jgi:hypothetical protein
MLSKMPMNAVLHSMKFFIFLNIILTYFIEGICLNLVKSFSVQVISFIEKRFNKKLLSPIQSV